MGKITKARPDLRLEKKFAGLVVGIDEVGRGPWAGPVVAAAVIFTNYRLPSLLSKHLNDSKKVTEKKREELYDYLITYDKCHWSVGEASVEEIDKINVVQATFLAMQRAVNGLTVMPEVALVDGHIVPKLPCQTIPVVNGDQTSISIAAASILAKITRDRYMKELSAHFPQYGWETNVGYGTKEHQEGLKLHGICVHHRKSFAPIKELIEAA